MLNFGNADGFNSRILEEIDDDNEAPVEELTHSDSKQSITSKLLRKSYAQSKRGSISSNKSFAETVKSRTKKSHSEVRKD